MINFLKGWRRKVGCVTLALACIFAAGWVRSLNGVAIGIDRVRFPCGIFDRHEIASFRRGLLWERVTLINKSDPPKILPGQERAVFQEIAEGTVQFHLPHLAGALGDDPDLHFEWRWKYLGFDSGELRRDKFSATFWIIPYWSIVVPLTALSAWLLLTKPRKPAKKVEP